MTFKILYISGSIGLGHVTRDISIVNELRKRRKDIEIVWLADTPSTAYLRAAGESVLADMEKEIASPNDICDEQAREYTLNLNTWFLAYYSTFPERVKLINSIVERENIDLIVGDETYDLYCEIAKNPKLKIRPFLLILDFIGCHLHDGVEKKMLPAIMFNTWTYRHIKNFHDKEDTIFIGEVEDVVDEKLRFLLPSRREAAKRYTKVVGYTLSFNPDTIQSKAELRKKLGYGPEPLVIVTVGGTAVGAALLNKAAEAYPILKKTIKDLNMVIVAGPRIPTNYVKANDGLKVLGMVPDLYEHMAAADLVVCSGGGTTTLELQALNKPFLYFPLLEHFEQSIDVAYHLERNNIGVKMDYSKTSPEDLAKAVIDNIDKKPNYPKLSWDGVQRIAGHIDTLVTRIENGELKVA
ncbi:MAG: hypothetical protein LUQ09_05870 [Methanomassiliicoccales archaeon]|nr:hypothetical protein [Methanomassiliicoccales archaeon]